MANFVVVFDACVFYPAQLRDLLIRVARSDLFRARWTDRIHDEWTTSLRRNRPDIPPERLARTRELLEDLLKAGLPVTVSLLESMKELLLSAPQELGNGGVTF